MTPRTLTITIVTMVIVRVLVASNKQPIERPTHLSPEAALDAGIYLRHKRGQLVGA